jgi:hypothetical protein
LPTSGFAAAHGIAEADRERAAQLAFGDRPRMRPTTTGAIGKSNRRIRKPSTPKPASIDSSTTEGFAAMVPMVANTRMPA